MKKLILMIFLCLISIVSFSQDSTKIINYNYNTYNGKPITKGWLFSKDFYRVVYYKIALQDSLIQQLNENDSTSQAIIEQKNKEIVVLNEKLNNKDTLIAEKDKKIDNINKTYTEMRVLCMDKVPKDIYKKDIVKVGIGGFLLGCIVILIAK